MKKKTLNTFLLFLLISLILITIFSIVYWLEYKDDLDELHYIGDSEWQKPVNLEKELLTGNFSVISEKNHFKLFYIDKNQQTGEESLYISKNNFDGENIDKELFIKAQSLNHFSVIRDNDFNHLFVIIGENDAKQDLKYYKLDKENNIKFEKRLLDNIAYSISFTAKEYDDNFYLALTADNNNKNSIDLIKFDYKNNNVNNIKKVDFSESGERLGLRYPEFIFKNDKIYLSYLREDPAQLFTSTTDKTNKRQVCLEILNTNFENLEEKYILDRAFKRDKNSTPEMILDEEKLNVFYHHYNLDDKVLNMNKAVFSLKKSKLENVEKVGNSAISSLDHLKKDNTFYLVYSKFRNISSSLYLYQNTNVKDVNDANLLFSQYKMSSNPDIFESEKGLHIIWAENNNNRKNLYYSTNLNSRKAGFFEIIGLNLSGESSVFFVAPLYMMAMPFVALIKNFHILFISGILLILLYISTNKYNLEKLKNKLDNVYISFTIIMIIFGIMASFLATSSNFFFPEVPEFKYIPFMFLAAFIAVLVMLNRSEVDTELSPFLAIGGSILWFYWVAQINLVFFISHYFY